MKRFTVLIIIITLAAVHTFALTETVLSGNTADSWVCPDCGNNATGNFCSNCGSRKPEDSSAGAAEEETGEAFFYGTWYCTAVIQNGAEIDVSNSTEIKAEITLNEDGTFQIYASTSKSNPVKGTWIYVNSSLLRLEADSESMEASYSDGRLIIGTGKGDSIIFTKELTGKGQGNDFKIIKASSADDFLGVWVMDRVSVSGMTFSTMDLHAISGGMSIKMTISEDTATIEIKADGQTASRYCSSSYENGVLYLRPLFSTTNIAVMFTDSGELTYTQELNGKDTRFFLIRQ